MAETELVKMSSKGQLVVPESIREEEGFEPGDRFISIPIKDGVMFKKVHIPDFKAEYERLSKELREQMKRKKIPRKTVDEAIRWARRQS